MEGVAGGALLGLQVAPVHLLYPHRVELRGGAFITWQALCFSLDMYWCIKPHDTPVRGHAHFRDKVTEAQGA